MSIHFTPARTNWQRVSRSRLCPICEKPDWCLTTGPEDYPTAAICARVESNNRAGQGGWLHQLRKDDSRRRRPIVRIRHRNQPLHDFTSFARACYKGLTPRDREHLAKQLGLSAEALNSLRVGWSVEHGSYTFPMRGCHNNVIGIRLRSKTGHKWSVPGSKQGIFIPAGLSLPPELLLITEGPTDAGALHDLGFDVIGRPSCTGGADLIVGYISTGGQCIPNEVVIVSDHDKPGQQGARSMASEIIAYVPNVRIITPPESVKDVRQWKHQGATRHDILLAIKSAPALKIAIKGVQQ